MGLLRRTISFSIRSRRLPLTLRICLLRCLHSPFMLSNRRCVLTGCRCLSLLLSPFRLSVLMRHFCQEPTSSHADAPFLPRSDQFERRR